MKNWNDELARQRRHILLLIDNAPSHIVDEYSNINIQFLPPNTTSKIQPLNQGIIRSVKCAYRKTIQVQYCSRVENYEEVKQIMQSFDFVVAVNTLVDAWEGVKPELIQTCFHTAGFMTYVPPPPEPLPEPPRNLWERMQNIFDVNCTFEEYATADDHAESSQPMTDEDIINAVHNHDSPSAIPPDLHIYNRHIYMMKWYKVTGATGWQKMRDRACTAQHRQVVRRLDLHGRAGDI